MTSVVLALQGRSPSPRPGVISSSPTSKHTSWPKPPAPYNIFSGLTRSDDDSRSARSATRAGCHAPTSRHVIAGDPVESLLSVATAEPKTSNVEANRALDERIAAALDQGCVRRVATSARRLSSTRRCSWTRCCGRR
jgi:hypothetical protein